MKTVSKRGTELRIGETVKVWWKPGMAQLLSLRPHPKYKEMFGVDGAMIGNFGGTEMTIEPHMMYDVFYAE
jgi:hypothetical protein